MPASRWNGAVAQLGERVVRNDEVRGSIPLGSTRRQSYDTDFFAILVSLTRRPYFCPHFAISCPASFHAGLG
jgi:hypothetical protein